MSQQKPIFNYDDEGQVEKLSRKAKDAPFMIIGLAGLLTACAIGGYQYKRRGAMSTSVFLMQYRVVAQGTVVGCLTLGLAYKMFDEYVWHPQRKAAEEKKSISDQ